MDTLRVNLEKWWEVQADIPLATRLSVAFSAADMVANLNLHHLDRKGYKEGVASIRYDYNANGRISEEKQCNVYAEIYLISAVKCPLTSILVQFVDPF